MNKYELNYGKGTISFEIPDANFQGKIVANKVEPELIGEAAVLMALENPIGSPRLKDLVKAEDKVVIVTSDITRPVPSYRILPLVIDELKAGGVLPSQITVVFGLGSHRPHTEDEMRALVGDKVWEMGVRLVDSTPDDCVELGICRNGTPADISRIVVEADKRICLGNVEFHYFAGYSGGNKALMPGVSSRRAIQANHSNMVKPGAMAGKLEGNPVREDIDQITDFISIDFILNVVLSESKEIIFAHAGHSVEAHRAGCLAIDALYKIPIEQKADIVILSPGGYPKDINLYQAQKGLDNAKHAVKKGGILIFCASAKEGFGEELFGEWMVGKKPQEMIDEIRRDFKLGAHKAAAIAMILQDSEIYMVSDMDEQVVSQMGFTPFKTAQEALDAAIAKKGPGAKVLVMPQAGSTLPILKD